MTERRKFLRFTTAISALCEIVSSKFKGSYKVKNISKEGALLEIDQRLRIGDEIKLSMEVPGDNVPIFAACQIAWQKETGIKSSYHTGVKFTNMHSSDKGRLLEYIYLEWLKLLDKK
ncbi:MAG TPA: PilZ domain-containing protein [Candidatus Omnitrophota bacterium]|nr:PilZ domain-containing protein [Candidatus Omnitrophota bacterium]